MPKQEYKILEFHGGTNNLFDPRDIAENQNVYTALSTRSPGRLTLEGSAMTLYEPASNLNGLAVTDAGAAGNQADPQSFVAGYGLFSFSHDFDLDGDEVDTDFIIGNDKSSINIYDPNKATAGWYSLGLTTAKFTLGSRLGTVKPVFYNVDGALRACDSNFETVDASADTASTDIVQDGDDTNPADANWIALHNDGSGDDGWTDADPSVFTDGGGTSSLINILAAPYLQKGESYNLTFTVGTAQLNMLIGGGTASGSSNLPNETFIAATNYAASGTPHTVTFTPTEQRTHLWFTAYDASAGSGSLDNVILKKVNSISENDTTIGIDDGSDGNVTIATGALIQIDNEIMYVTSGGTKTSFPVTRGYANTKIKAHADNTDVYYANVPKYFGHIKQDRLFEATYSDSINAWVEDVQTPQPPNNTRKGSGTTGVIAASAGMQSLRLYDINSDSTSNYPTEAEKVVMEFVEDSPDMGIMKITKSGDRITATISGVGDDASAGHGLSVGETIKISGTISQSPTADTAFATTLLEGEHEIVGTTPTTISFDIEGTEQIAVDYDAASYRQAASAIADGDVPNTIKLTQGLTELPSSGTYWVHITAATGLTSLNGVKLATAISTSQFYFRHPAATLDYTGAQIQQLLGTITKVGEDAIVDDLKKKWNFAMSFTYDGPGNEAQESLLNQGYKITQLTQADGITKNQVNDGSGFNDSVVTFGIDDGTSLSVNDVIMIGSEQILVTNIADDDADGAYTPATLTAIRGYNGSAADTQADDADIYKVEELTPTATIDWTTQTAAPICVIKFLYNHGVSGMTWNPRINGFKIYMKDVTLGDSTKDWFLFSSVNFNKGTYQILAADESELILEQPGTWGTDAKVCTISTGTNVGTKPIDTYLSENQFTEDTFIDAQYKCSENVGRKTYIGNIMQGGRTYPDRMLVSPVNRFDTFPETNFIDVAIGDGDSIIALKSFGDRLLQFKKNSVYVINVAGDVEVLESEYHDNGISFPSQVCKTSTGISWINNAGLWYFDGQNVTNVTLYVEDDGFTCGVIDTFAGRIGYDKKNNRVIFTEKTGAGALTAWRSYYFDLKAYQSYVVGGFFPFSESSTNFYTNMINTADGELIAGYVDDATNNEMNFYKWSNSDKGHLHNNSVLHKTKDVDLGSPGVRKKIYKVYVTYKSTGHSGVKMKYATNGGTTFSDFSSSKSTNYDVESFSTNGTKTGFKKSDGEWQVAELKPSSSINNVYSFQLSLDVAGYVHQGTARSGGGTTSIVLATAASATDNIYDDYNIHIYGGAARYNSKLIENDTNGTGYVGSTRTVTLYSAMTDKGYGASPGTTTKYSVGAAASDFEINDITVIFRAKPVK